MQLPGVDDPEHVKALLGRTAKLTFQMVDNSVTVEEAGAAACRRAPRSCRRRTRPASAAARALRRAQARHGRRRHADRRAGRPSSTATSRSSASRFDAVGARRFGDATRENVGKPFAIVLDNKVISAPVIREPILGGSGQHLRQLHGRSRPTTSPCCCAPAPCRRRSTVLEERTVGPELGADSIQAGTIASDHRGGPRDRLHGAVLRPVRRLRQHRAVLQPAA